MKDFEKPTQVMFIDDDNETCFGIAFGDTVICGCCGSTFDVSEVEIVQTLEWIDISDAIRGE